MTLECESINRQVSLGLASKMHIEMNERQVCSQSKDEKLLVYST
jgi:hypothetical protein